MKKFLSALLLLALLIPAIAGCRSSKNPESTTAPDSSEATESSSSATENPTESTTSPSTTETTNASTSETTESTPSESEETTTDNTEPPVELNNNAYGEAYYIIETYTDIYNGGLPNGWIYDNRFDLLNKNGGEDYKISDSSDEQYFSFIRKFDPESNGILRLELLIGFSSSNGGAYITFANSADTRFVTVTEQNGYFAIVGTSTVVTNISVPSAGYVLHSFTIEVDLDSNKASVIINNQFAGEVSIDAGAVISRLVLGTEEVGGGSIELRHAELNKNYPLSDRFMIPSDQVGAQPVGWNVTGDFKLGYIPSEYYHNVYSIKAESAAGTTSTAVKSFGAIYGKISFETFILLPEKVDGASVALTSGGVEILKFETKDGKIVIGDIVLHDYSANVWQNLHIDADTDTGIATIYINGKKKADVRFTAESFDGVNITFAPDKDAVMWFDDVVLYNLYDYADYPEYPQVAESKDYNVGVNVCWLWRDSNSGEGWDAASGFSELDTYLGFYDEGLRETADWELKYMAEHGIDFMNVCWYCPGHDVQVPIKKMYRSYAALHEGYMYAKYSDLVKFCILWENDTRGFTNFDQFKDIVWAYWKEYYLCDDRYMRLDNKAIITVWSKELLIDMFGGEDEFKKAVEFMEQELIDMGYDGLILLFTTQGREVSGVYDKYSSLGYDGSYAYHFGAGGYDPELQIDINQFNSGNALDKSSHHVPTISVGFNSLPRHETRYPLITEADHLAVCEAAKDLLATYNTGTWKDNTVIISTWNEYTEGTYIFPTSGIGFSYLENIRKAFTDDTSDHSEIDVKPTLEQVDRVSHMYPDDRTTLSWLNFEPTDKDKESNSVENYVTVREFNSKEWSINHNVGKFKNTNGVIEGRGNSHDFGIKVNFATPLNADEISIIHIRMRVDTKGDAELYFITPDDTAWDASRRFAETVTVTDEMVDYYFMVGNHAKWTGEISGLRFDPGSVSGTAFSIELIEFMTLPEVTRDQLYIYINHTEYVTEFYPVLLEKGDYEVVAHRGSGFFTMMLLTHEWNRFDQTLTLRTRDNKTYVFTVGSDKVLIDGREKRLGYTFTLRDGLPVFRIQSLCSLLDYKFTLEGNVLMIQSCTDEEYTALANSSDGGWDFNLPNSIDGWIGENNTLSISGNGTLICTPENTDPILRREVDFPASQYNTIVVGIKYFAGLEDIADPKVHFQTDRDYTMDGIKSVTSTYIIPDNVKVGDTVIVVFDMFNCGYWNGTIKGIRIDAINESDHVFEIDYIKLENTDHGDDVKPSAGIWDFENEGDIGGWIAQNVTLEAKGDGYLSVTPSNSDPAVLMQLYANAMKFSTAVIGVKYFEGLEDHTVVLYFNYSGDNTFTEDSSGKYIYGSYDVPAGTKVGDTVYATFNLLACNAWDGIINFVRFDPIGGDTPFEIDVIRLQ